MPALLAFAAGAVVGAVASSLVRNRRLACKTLELAGSLKETLCGLCQSGRERVTRLVRPGWREEPADGPIVSTPIAPADSTKDKAS